VLLEVSVEDAACRDFVVEVVLVIVLVETNGAAEVHVVDDETVVETDFVAVNSIVDVKTVDVAGAVVMNVDVDKSVVNVAVDVVELVLGQPRFL